MAGRKPKPTNLKILEGNPGKRPLPTREPKPAPVAPKCPSWISREAKKEWKRVAPQLERLGLLTQMDMVALAGYCEAWATYIEASTYLQEHGLIYEVYLRGKEGDLVPGEDGRPILLKSSSWPQAAIAHKALTQVRAFCSEFGFTPSARGRMSVPGADESDGGMSDLLSGVRPSAVRQK